MIFLGQPGLTVVDSKSPRRKAYRFDDNGELNITDPKLIPRMKRRYKVKPEDLQPIQDETPACFQCKKCDYDTDNRGQLMAHYRVSHPKED